MIQIGPILLVMLTGISCISNPNKEPEHMLIEVWTQPGWPPEDLPPPDTFKLSPNAAFAAAARSRKLSLKHQWFCFRDDRYYYIADAFGRTVSAQAARRHGVCVDGQTGTLK